jgi:hypothetical protein
LYCNAKWLATSLQVATCLVVGLLILTRLNWSATVQNVTLFAQLVNHSKTPKI